MRTAVRLVVPIALAITSVVAVVLLALHARDARLIRGLAEENRRISQECEQKKEHASTDERLRLGRAHVNALKRRGLRDPFNDIARDLISHPELIPFGGTHGGKMGFYSSDAVVVLTSRWVLASFEDGHNGGYVLLRYQVDEGGRIRWERLAAYEDEGP